VTIVDIGDEPRHRVARAALPEARWIDLDLLEVDPSEVLGDCDRVIHLAGRPGVQTSWGTGFAEHLSANTLLTQRLLEAALVTRPERVVLASSSSVYGNIPEGLAHEDRVLKPLSPYGVSKAAVETLMGAYVARGASVVALRFFTVYGRGQRPDMALHRIIEAGLGGPAFELRGSGCQARDFTHVDDVAAAIEASLFAPVAPGTVCNVGAGRPVSLTELISTVERQLGREVPVTRVPAANGDPSRTAADPVRARRLLGWSPSVSLEDGVADQIRHQLPSKAAAEVDPAQDGQIRPRFVGSAA
jgi:nucleoside-diphosphate-sugar epimerase